MADSTGSKDRLGETAVPESGPRGDGYLLDNQQAPAGTRFQALSALFDPATFRHIDGLGIAAGWRCWEAGAGGTTVAAWLSGRVGPTGYVVATDIDTTWLTAPQSQPFEVRRHDVATEAPPGDDFDLVHARLLLVHVPERDSALRSMVAALKPGGWLFVEDADTALQPLACLDEHGDEQRLANRLRLGFRQLLAQRGADLAFGRTLPRRLREAGLVDVRADAFFPVTSPACNLLELATMEQVRDRLETAGIVTREEIEQHLSNIAAGRLDVATAPMISAWGRKPPAPTAQSRAGHAPASRRGQPIGGAQYGRGMRQNGWPAGSA